MSYAEKVQFLSKMCNILLTLPIDIQKYIGTFYNKKYDNKYIKLMVLNSPKVKIPEQIYIKKQYEKEQINVIKSYPALLNVSEKEYNIIQKQQKYKHKCLKYYKKKYKKHIIDGRKLKEINNSTYIEYYCDHCKYYYDDTNYYEHQSNIFECCDNCGCYYWCNCNFTCIY
jgi:hypothetical protein